MVIAKVVLVVMAVEKVLFGSFEKKYVYAKMMF